MKKDMIFTLPMVLVFAFPLILIVLKILQIVYEPPDPKLGVFVRLLTWGICRRIDDPSFWSYCGYALACPLMVKTIKAASPTQERIFSSRRSFLLFVLVTIVIVGSMDLIYCMKIRQMDGTLFWVPPVKWSSIPDQLWPDRHHNIRIIKGIQLLEGVSKFAVLSIVHVVCSLGFFMALRIRENSNAQAGKDLVLATFAQVTTSFLFFPVYLLIDKAIPGELQNDIGSEALGEIMIYSAFFILLFLWCYISWLGRLEMSFGIRQDKFGFDLKKSIRKKRSKLY